MTETSPNVQDKLDQKCDHMWVHKAGAGYRSMPVAICTKCYAEKTYCPKCGVKL